MATVTGLTAARMLEIEGASVVSGAVVGNNLILTKHDATTINAGSVVGPQGPTGPAGDVSTAQLNAALAGLLPVGVILDYVGTTAPTNWLAMTGQTITNGQTIYPALWASLPASMKSGSNIIFPDTRGRVTVGHNSGDTDFDTIGEVGGAKTHTLTQAQLPAVGVSIDPPATTVAIDPPSTVVSGGSHTHTYNDPQTATADAPDGGASILLSDSLTSSATTGGTGSHSHTVDIPSFNATVNIGSFTSGNMGSGQAHNIMQPYVVFLKIIKVA